MAQILSQVKLGTVGNFDLADALTIGNSTIDGVIIYAGDRILVKSQTDRKENGVYYINSTGYLIRASDFANGSTQTPSTVIFIQQGDQLADTGWILSTDSNTNAITVGSAEIEFTRFSVNMNILGADLPSSIVLRSEKGYPLTNTELDNNFKYLAVSLTQKLNIADFTQPAICDRINSVDYTVSNINANHLQGFYPTTEYLQDTSTIALRTSAGNITSLTFTGDLIGNADTATVADLAFTAHALDQINPVQFGGTGSDTAAGARANLNVVNRAGDSMTGKLSLAAANTGYATLNIPAKAADINAPQDGDIWASATQLFYRSSGNTYTFAPLQSPAITGTPTAPTTEKASNSDSLATTKFVQLHVTDLNNAIALKAPIDSPTLTGNPKSVTPATTDNDTSIATTAFVVNKFDAVMPYYYTKDQADILHANESNARSTKDTSLQAQIDDLAKMRGIPVGMVGYYAAANIPVGWLKCDGSLVSKNAYLQLFNKIGYTYGGSGNDFRLPDLRGEFIRGWDDGRGVDAGRVFGSAQKGTLIAGKFGGTLDGDWDTASGILFSTATGDPTNTFGSDSVNATTLAAYNNGTVGVMMDDDVPDLGVHYGAAAMPWLSIVRPRNTAMLACIKAYGDIEDPDVINATSVLDSIGYKVDKRGDTMVGTLKLAADPVEDLQAATKHYVDAKVNAVSLTPGPQGPQGSQGPQGAQGPAGVPYTITSGTNYTNGFTNIVWYWNDTYNWFDVYPPAGKTMGNLLAFMPSIAIIYYAGGVNGDDATRCIYTRLNDRVRVYVQNSEQRSTPAANWIAFWS